MKLSIIIPCYNCAGTIERCLESIGTNSNVAVILINDKSTDNTEQIISKYIKLHPNDKYLLINNDKNLGAGESRNIGLGYVNSDYFMFADSDDRFMPDYYESIIKSLETYKSDCLIFDAWRLVDGKERYFDMFFSAKIEEGYLDKREAFVFVKGCPWCKVYSTKVLMNQNVRFANLKVNEDLVFTKKAILQCDKIFYLSKPLYIYEDVPTSLMHTTKRDPSNYIDAYRMIEYEQIADYAEELCAMYALEVVCPTLLTACMNGYSNREIQRILDEIGIEYRNNKYIKQYDIKHRLLLMLIKYRLNFIIKLLLKLC